VLSGLAVELLASCQFPARGEPLDCAVSGGPDSLALLALAVAAGCRPTAYHVDHGLRAGSADEAEVVREAASRLGAAFVSLRVDLAPGPNLEARARAARFAVLPEGVATGHTADDQAETILLNFVRGAGLRGLAGMVPGRRHPILGLRRADTEDLVDELGLAVVRDPSNADPAFRRNRVRAELLPLIGDISRRDPVPVLVRQAALLSEEAELLDAMAAALDPTSTASLGAAPLALRRRAVRSWLTALSDPPYPPDAAAVERVLAVASGAVVACEVPGGLRIRRSRGRLIALRGSASVGGTKAVR
jgi:tRNA(Ile)-lysidine synthase